MNIYSPTMEEVEQRLNAIRCGNAHAAEPRDLTLVRGPYWSTRREPAKPHHFTRGEFEEYLYAERFPINTLADRVVEHTQAVRRALVAGVFVPAEVMSDESGREALALAQMDVRAHAEGAWALAQQKDAILMFEEAIGCYTPNGKPGEVIRGLLMAAARAKVERPRHQVDWSIYAWVAEGCKRVTLAGHPREILIGMRQGRGGRPWLEFRDSGWSLGSLYGEVRRMSHIEAEGIYAKAVADGEVTLAQARSVMGAGWRPFLIVQVCDSAKALA